MVGAWRVKSQRSMWPPAVVVGAVPGEDSLQVPLAEDQDAVGEVGSGGPDEAFGEAVRPQPARRDLHRVDASAGQDGIEGGGELAGAVADEEPESGGAVGEVHQQVAGLLGGPRSGRMTGCPEYMDVAVADFQGEEDVDPFQGDRAVDVEEVHGQRARGLRAQAPPPGRIGGPQRRRGYPSQREEFADRGCADAVAELEKLALDALVAPGLVLTGQPLDQFGDGVVEAWAPAAVRVGPLPGHQAAVPPQDRGRGDQAVAA